MRKPTLANLRKPAESSVPATLASPVEHTGRSRPDVRKMSVYVPEATWKALQLRKIDEGRDVNRIINDAIKTYLASGSGI